MIELFSFVMTLAIDKNNYCSFLLINIDDGLNTVNYIHVVNRVSVFLGSLYVTVCLEITNTSSQIPDL